MNKYVKILMQDGCTCNEAKRHLNGGAKVYEQQDFETHFVEYMREWGTEDCANEFLTMLTCRIPVVENWGVVGYEGKVYLISYCLQEDGYNEN